MQFDISKITYLLEMLLNGVLSKECFQTYPCNIITSQAYSFGSHHSKCITSQPFMYFPCKPSRYYSICFYMYFWTISFQLGPIASCAYNRFILWIYENYFWSYRKTMALLSATLLHYIIDDVPSSETQLNLSYGWIDA